MSQSRSTTRIRISLDSGEGRTRSPIGLIGAIAIHVAIIGATLFTWEHRLDIAQETAPIVPVDLVTIAQKTNIAPTVLREPKVEPEQVKAPPPPDLVAQTPPLPPEQSEAAPEQTPSKPVVKPQPPPAVPKAKPQPTIKKASVDLDKLIAQLAAPTAHPQQSGKVAPTAHKGIGAQTAMSMDLADALRNQIEQKGCWDKASFAGSPHPEQLIVYIELSLNPDGSVARAPQLAAQSVSALAANPFARAAADAAFRAIYVCAPFKLPVDRYAEWRDSVVKFDPRDLDSQ